MKQDHHSLTLSSENTILLSWNMKKAEAEKEKSINKEDGV